MLQRGRTTWKTDGWEANLPTIPHRLMRTIYSILSAYNIKLHSWADRSPHDERGVVCCSLYTRGRRDLPNRQTMELSVGSPSHDRHAAPYHIYFRGNEIAVISKDGIPSHEASRDGAPQWIPTGDDEGAFASGSARSCIQPCSSHSLAR